MHLSNMNGIIGKSFRIGYGDDAVILAVEKETVDGQENIVLKINAKIKGDGLDIGDGSLNTSAIPKNDNDVINVKALNEALKTTSETLSRYTDEKIKELTGGTTGANIMLLPIRVTIDDITDGYSNAFGKLAANKFVDRIIFEVLEGFDTGDDSKFDISIGTVTSPEAFVPKFSIENLASTYIVNICKTLSVETDFVFYVYKHEEIIIPTFEQEVYANHDGVSYSMTSDSSKKIWNITMSGDNLIRDVDDVETFGTLDGALMDFGINLPVEANHRYRIVQRNSALQFYKGIDGYVSESNGIWTKDKNYSVGDDTEFIYKFLMTESEGDSDYVHIWLYDLDSETPDEAIRTYHIKNSLYFEGTSGANALLQNTFLSASEGSVGIVKNDATQYTVTLTGEVHSQNTQMAELYPNLSGNLTMFGFYYPKALPAEGVRLAIYNPVYSQVADQEGIKVENGIYYLDTTVQDPDNQDGMWVYVPISDSQDYPVVIAIIDLATNETFLVGIDNELTFLPEEVAEDETSESEAAVAAFNLTSDTAVLSETGVKSGSMIVRILSF